MSRENAKISTDTCSRCGNNLPKHAMLSGYKNFVASASDLLKTVPNPNGLEFE
jgi:hypothetical protein